MNQTLTNQLLEKMHSLSFHAFEECLGDLLAAMGYEEVTLLGRTRSRQFTRHGGRDMEVQARTGITKARLILQAKQYRRPVSRRFVDELRGTALRIGARQGLLITTSTFPKAARLAAETSIAPVQLIDGERLVQLMVTYRIGITMSPLAASAAVSIDEDYFAQLQAQFPEKSPSPLASTAPARSTPATMPSQVVVYALLPNLSQGGTMLWRTHVVAGVNTLWLFYPLPGVLTSDTFPILVLLSAFGALLPDLDASMSKIRTLSIGSIRPFAPLSVLMHRAFGHRGFLHSPEALFLLALALLPVALWWGVAPPVALWLGYASHLVLDACTPSGIPRSSPPIHRFYLLPLSMRIRTGSEAENILLVLLTLAALLLALSQLLALLLPLS